MRMADKFRTVNGRQERWNEVRQEWQARPRLIVSTEQRSVARKLSEPTGAGAKLVECYEALGFSHDQAVIAAGIEKGVRSGNVNKAFDAGVKLGLFESAKLLGLSDAEAVYFANPDKAVNVSTSPFLEAAKKK
jgi:hypothetical protein